LLDERGATLPPLSLQTATPAASCACATPTVAVASASVTANPTAGVQSGTVVAWGDDSRGQTKVPAGLAGVVAVAAGMSSAWR